MTPPLHLPAKEVDIGFLVFVERYATDLLKWDVLTFFGRNPDFYGQTAQIAERIGRSSLSIRPELGNLALLGILERTEAENHQTTYRLTAQEHPRQMTIKLAGGQLGTTALNRAGTMQSPDL